MPFPWPTTPRAKALFLEMLTMPSEPFKSILLTPEIRNLPSPDPGKGMMPRKLGEAPKPERVVKAFQPPGAYAEHVARLVNREDAE